MVLPLVGAAWLGDKIFNNGKGAAAVTGAIDSAADDFMSVGSNRYQGQAYQPGDLQYGGQYGADNLAKAGLDRMNQSGQRAAWAQGQAQANRGPQAFENQDLSNREAASRYGDQAGAMQLAREAAMGMAPSQAAYQLQSGLDRGLAQQSAIAGSARGGAGIALASANANAAGANMQSQAFTESGRMRAQEMADARGLYGGLSGQQRQQDLERLGMGNQMSQFNAGLNDSYRLGMGQLANQGSQTGLGWYQASQNPYDRQAQMDLGREQLAADSYNQNEARRAGVAQANADARARNNERMWGLAGSVVNFGGQGIAAGMGGGKGKP